MICIDIFMKLICYFEDGQLKTLIEVISVNNSFFYVEEGEVVKRNKKKYITLKRGLQLCLETHMI